MPSSCSFWPWLFTVSLLSQASCAFVSWKSSSPPFPWESQKGVKPLPHLLFSGTRLTRLKSWLQNLELCDLECTPLGHALRSSSGRSYRAAVKHRVGDISGTMCLDPCISLFKTNSKIQRDICPFILFFLGYCWWNTSFCICKSAEFFPLGCIRKPSFSFLFINFWDRASLSCPGWSWIHSALQAVCSQTFLSHLPVPK